MLPTVQCTDLGIPTIIDLEAVTRRVLAPFDAFSSGWFQLSVFTEYFALSPNDQCCAIERPLRDAVTFYNTKHHVNVVFMGGSAQPIRRLRRNFDGLFIEFRGEIPPFRTING